MATRRGSGELSPPLLIALVVNLLFSLALLGLASWELNQQIELRSIGANDAIFDLVRFAMTASLVAIASILMGLFHAKQGRGDSHGGAVAAAVIALLLALLAAGVASKHINKGTDGDRVLDKHGLDRGKAIDAFAIASAASQLFYTTFLVLEI